MGARYRRLIKQELIIKTDFLRVLEDIANRSSLEELAQIGKALSSGVRFNDLLRSLQGNEQLGVSKKELNHVEKDWFDPETGWWREFNPEEQMRAGLVRAIALRTENARDGRPLPAAYFWSPNADRFAFVPLLSEHQLTVILLTPPEPKLNGPVTPTRRAATRSKVAATPRKTVVKGASSKRGKKPIKRAKKS